MDTSNRLGFILGNLRVPVEEVTPGEWLEIMKKVVETCTPILQYFNGFTEIKERMNSRHEYDSKRTPPEVCEFPADFSGETRCMYLANIHFSTDGDAGPGRGRLFSNNDDLFITQSGCLVRWQARYRRDPHHGQGYRGHRSGTAEVAVNSKFSLVSDEGFLEIFKLQPQVVPILLVNLSHSLGKSIQAKRLWMAALEDRYDHIKLIQSKLIYKTGIL